jgi:hypothetical protein
MYKCARCTGISECTGVPGYIGIPGCTHVPGHINTRVTDVPGKRWCSPAQQGTVATLLLGPALLEFVPSTALYFLLGPLPPTPSGPFLGTPQLSAAQPSPCPCCCHSHLPPMQGSPRVTAEEKTASQKDSQRIKACSSHKRSILLLPMPCSEKVPCSTATQ